MRRCSSIIIYSYKEHPNRPEERFVQIPFYDCPWRESGWLFSGLPLDDFIKLQGRRKIRWPGPWYDSWWLIWSLLGALYWIKEEAVKRFIYQVMIPKVAETGQASRSLTTRPACKELLQVHGDGRSNTGGLAKVRSSSCQRVWEWCSWTVKRWDMWSWSFQEISGAGSPQCSWNEEWWAMNLKEKSRLLNPFGG